MGAHARRAICLTMACIPELGCSLLRELIQHLLPGVAWLEPGRRPPPSTQDRSLQRYTQNTSCLSFGQPPIWPLSVLQRLIRILSPKSTDAHLQFLRREGCNAVGEVCDAQVPEGVLLGGGERLLPCARKVSR